MNLFELQTSVRTEVTGDALREIVKEFGDIRNQLVPSDELENAKRALVASFALSTENQATALSNATTLKEYPLPAGKLLGHLSGEDRFSHCRRRAARGAEICAA
jgi:predicted Zn-dependent peptidase